MTVIKKTRVQKVHKMIGFSEVCLLYLLVNVYDIVNPVEAFNYEEGDRCGQASTSGICTKVTECPPARESVKLRKTHNFERCGFASDGWMEVVCCPEEELNLIPQPRGPTVSTNRPIWTDEPPVEPVTPDDTSTELKERNAKRKAAQACEEYVSVIKPQVTFHIIDGENAEEGEFPHMVALGYKQPGEDELRWNCGGTLISERYVLTAAHCIINVENLQPVKARMGVVNLKGPYTTSQPEDFDIENSTIHPDYVWSKKLNDIGLLKLSSDVKFTKYISPACLYTKDDDPLGLVVTGWGLTSEMNEETSNTLQKAAVTPVPVSECNITFVTRVRKHITNSQICAGDTKSDTCQGDSGGPLQVQNIQGTTVYNIVGVTSYGISCGGKYPGVYTRVSSYLDWIEDHVWPDGRSIN